jgi:Flp pilus assembly protein TadD/cell division protein FtsN
MRSRNYLGIGVSALVLVAAISGMSAVESAVEATNAQAANARHGADLADQAQHALAKREAVKAVRLAESAVALDPRNAEYRVLLGQGYLLSGRFTSAGQALTDALTLDPGNGRAALNLALARIGTGDWNGAVATLNEHAQQIPAADLGLALALAGQAPRGVEVLGNAVRQPEANAKTRQNLALALALAGRWREAQQVAAVDLPSDQVDARMVQWIKFARPDNAYDQVAALLGVQVVADKGQPVELALRDSSTVMAAVTQTVQSTTASIDSYMPGTGNHPASAPVAAAPVAAAAVQPQPRAETVEAAPALASVGAGVVFGPRHEIVQPLPAARSAAAAPKAPAMAAREHARGDYYVQIGAYANAGVAKDAWARATHRIPALAQHAPLSANVTTKAGAFYRLAVGGFSRADAVELCSTVKAKGGNCFVRVGAGEKLASWAKGVQVASR